MHPLPLLPFVSLRTHEKCTSAPDELIGLRSVRGQKGRTRKLWHDRARSCAIVRDRALWMHSRSLNAMTPLEVMIWTGRGLASSLSVELVASHQRCSSRVPACAIIMSCAHRLSCRRTAGLRGRNSALRPGNASLSKKSPKKAVSEKSLLRGSYR